MNGITIQLDDSSFLGIERAKGELSSYTLYHSAAGIKKYILSKYRPKEKIEQILQHYSSGAETLWIILGFELGYTVETLLTEERINNKIIVVEPNEKVLEEQKKYICNKKILDDPRVEFFCGNDLIKLKKRLRSKTQKIGVNNINTIVLDNYKNVYPQYWVDVIKAIGEVKAEKQINMNTAFNTLSDFIYNIIRNRKYIQDSYDINQHQNQFKNIPALIVSAGPSLNKNIHLINKFNGLIFTGGRTVEKIVEQGKEPSFLVSIDARDNVYNILGELKENAYSLITMGASNWQLPKTNFGPQYFIDHGGYNSLVQQLVGSTLPEVDCGGSVATMCLSLAQYMGCSPIIFIGQDLALTNFESHAAGTYQTKKFSKETEGIKYISGYDEESVPSNISLIQFLRWIERFIERDNETLYINATEGGAKIQGTTQMTFEEVINKYNIEKIQVNHEKKLDIHMDSAAANIEQTLNVFQQLIKQAEKGLSISSDILKEYEKLVPDIQKVNKLSRQINSSVNERINKCLKDNIGISAIIKLLEHKVYSDNKFREPLNETVQESNVRTVKRAKEFYLEIKDICRECINIINQALQDEEK